MDNKIIDILSSVPKEILIHCVEIMAQKENTKSEEIETTRECVKVANLLLRNIVLMNV